MQASINSQILPSNWVFLALQVVVVLIIFIIGTFLCCNLFATTKRSTPDESGAHTNMANTVAQEEDEKCSLKDLQSKNSATPLTIAD
jgi:cell division protein FtsB